MGRKTKIYGLIGISVVVLTLIVYEPIISKRAISPVPGSCTIFSASLGNNILFGNNEDYKNTKTYYWTEPASAENYGAVYLGFENYSYQGGINEKGLCFDANSLPASKINPHLELPTAPSYEPPYERYAIWAPVLMLRKAATVEEAIKIASKYQTSNWYSNSGKLSYQINLADATGDAVVISVDQTGELTFSRKRSSDKYLVSTNFNIANSKNAFDYPCKRYIMATSILDRVNIKDELSVADFKSILDSTHVEGIFTNTLYSNIYDLKRGIIYLYYWHQFNEVAVLKVNEELSKGKVIVSLKDLFSKKTVAKASDEYKRHYILLFTGIIAGIGIIMWTIPYFKRQAKKVQINRHIRQEKL